jgi:precorrin-6B methylase 1
MKVRFQADADLNHIIVKATLRCEPAIDFQTAQTASLTGLKDQEVLAIAAREARLLVTHDRKTMPKHFAEFIKTERSSGVLIVPQKISITQAIEEIILIWAASEAEEWANRIYSLPL